MSSSNDSGAFVPTDLPQYLAPPAGATNALLGITQISNGRWNFPAAVGTPVANPGGIGTAVSVTYGFLTSPSAEMLSAGYTGFTVLTAAQQTGMRAALAAWSEVARLNLTETAGAGADIRIARTDQSSGGFAYFPSFGYSYNGANVITSVTSSAIGGDIFIGNGSALVMLPGTSGYTLALHESGHAIGLKHPFEGPVTLPAATDSTRFTVMSYTEAPHAGTVDVTLTGGGGYSWSSSDVQPRTPMLYDIATAQALYGANTATRAGDDSYAWTDHERFLMTIWDGGGNDTIDASNQTLDCFIDLADGAFSSIGIRATEAARRLDIPAVAVAVPTPSYDGRDNLAIAYGAVIENANGGSGNDVIHGNAVRNVLRGNDGDDAIFSHFASSTPTQGQGSLLYGGAGNDSLYAAAGARMYGGPGDDQYVTDNYRDEVYEVAGEGIDTVWAAGSHIAMWGNVEIGRLWGTGQQLQGNAGNNQIVANPAISSILKGMDGDDELWGSLLDNQMEGGAGDDIIRSQGGAGTFKGGLGNDQFVVTKAGTIVDEAVDEGVDTIWISVNGFIASQNVEIIRLAGSATTIETSISSEQVVANSLFASTIDASYGDDTIWGGAFADTLSGNYGDDVIRGQGGADVMHGGYGNDQFVVLDNGVIIEEGAGQGYDTAWYAVSGMALAANVERANLSGEANSIAGNASDNVIVGNPTLGNSFLGGGAGRDTIYGGAFADVFQGDAGDDTFYSGGGADRFVYQGPGWGYDQIAGWAAGDKLVFTGSGLTFGQLFLNSAGGNTQVEYAGSAILVFGAASLTATDFLF